MDKQILAKTDADPPRFLPGQAPEVVSVIEVLLAIRTASEDEFMNYARLPDNLKVDPVLRAYQEAATKSLQGVTLRDLIAISEQLQAEKTAT